MDGKTFRVLLDCAMKNDPGPLSLEEQEALVQVLDAQAYKWGFDSWIDAYHKFEVK